MQDFNDTSAGDGRSDVHVFTWEQLENWLGTDRAGLEELEGDYRIVLSPDGRYGAVACAAFNDSECQLDVTVGACHGENVYGDPQIMPVQVMSLILREQEDGTVKVTLPRMSFTEVEAQRAIQTIGVRLARILEGIFEQGLLDAAQSLQKYAGPMPLL